CARDGRPSQCDSNSVRHRATRRTNFPSRPDLQTRFIEFLRRHYFQGPHDPGHQWPPHVPDLVSDDSTAEERQAGFASSDHRSHVDDGFQQRDGAADHRRSKQDPPISEWSEVSNSYCRPSGAWTFYELLPTAYAVG